MFVFTMTVINDGCKINSSISCGVWSVFQFLNTENLNASEIRHELCEICEPSLILCEVEGKVSQWCCEVNECHTNVCNEERSEWPRMVVLNK